MLKRLRRKFIVITMVLTASVLIGVLGSTLYTSYATQRDMVEEALESSAEGELSQMPMMMGRGPRDDGFRPNMLALALDVSADGVVLETSHSPLYINPSVLSDVLSAIIESDADRGADSDMHLSWSRSIREDGSLRIVIVDTSVMDESLSKQVRDDLIITALALVAMFAIVWWLSGWALEPVARAWEEQKRFVADASHELKTPLAVILANTQILLGEEKVDPESMRWVESTQDEAEHMLSLVNELLELARTDEAASGGAGNALRREELDFSELVDAAALEFDALAFERGCTLEAEVEPGIMLEGDKDWLRRVVRIFIDNACKYADPGTTVTVRLVRATPHARLTVTNLGNPIDPEDLPHVFERFYRSDKARTRGTGGFGLGLAIAKGIVEAHGGEVSATSSAEAGTTFALSL